MRSTLLLCSVLLLFACDDRESTQTADASVGTTPDSGESIDGASGAPQADASRADASAPDAHPDARPPDAAPPPPPPQPDAAVTPPDAEPPDDPDPDPDPEVCMMEDGVPSAGLCNADPADDEPSIPADWPVFDVDPDDEEAPYRTIADALAAAGARPATLRLAPGEYREPVVAAGPLAIAGAGPGRTRLVGGVTARDIERLVLAASRSIAPTATSNCPAWTGSPAWTGCRTRTR